MAKDIKYPFLLKEERIKIPVLREKDSAWVGAFLNEDGTTEINAFAGHHTPESCWVVCRAYNGRVGYSEEQVEKILKQYGYGKKGQKKQKGKKDKKGKKKKKKKDKS